MGQVRVPSSETGAMIQSLEVAVVTMFIVNKLSVCLSEVLYKTYEKPVPFRSRYFFHQYVTPTSPIKKLVTSTTSVSKVDGMGKRFVLVFTCK